VKFAGGRVMDPPVAAPAAQPVAAPVVDRNGPWGDTPATTEPSTKGPWG
jgi:hypothetical protein